MRPRARRCWPPLSNAAARWCWSRTRLGWASCPTILNVARCRHEIAEPKREAIDEKRCVFGAFLDNRLGHFKRDLPGAPGARAFGAMRSDPRSHFRVERLGSGDKDGRAAPPAHKLYREVTLSGPRTTEHQHERSFSFALSMAFHLCSSPASKLSIDLNFSGLLGGRIDIAIHLS